MHLHHLIVFKILHRRRCFRIEIVILTKGAGSEIQTDIGSIEIDGGEGAFWLKICFIRIKTEV